MESLKGKTLKDRYRIDESLGQGGMAEVYKAFDQKRAGYVAVKLLREDLSRDKVFIKRFEREAKTLSQLQHRNIVRFYGLERDNLDVFIVMDYIEGDTLRDVIFKATKSFSIEETLTIIKPVCSALHYAHEMGIVHCDIKPGNIILAKNGDVMVSDFGIARSMDAATSTMVGIGTPAYMAPELVRGEDPTPQSDIYSLGITIYEMLTNGERPFTGDRAGITGTTAEKVRWEHLYGEVIPPHKFNKSIPKYIENAILKCLEKDPKDRFKTVQEFLYVLSNGEGKEAPNVISKDIVRDISQQKNIENQEKSNREVSHIDKYILDFKTFFSKAEKRIEKEWNLMSKQAKIVVISIGVILIMTNIFFATLAFRDNPGKEIDTNVRDKVETSSLPTKKPQPTITPTPMPICDLVDKDLVGAGWQEYFCGAFSSAEEIDGWKTDESFNDRVAIISLEDYKDKLDVRAEMFQDLVTTIVSPAEDLRDFYISVEGRLSSYAGHPYHEWGLALKKDGNDYYYFSIDSKSNYYFNLVRDGKVSTILDGRFSSDILPIDEVNRLTVTVDGYEYSLYINGVLQTTVKDNRILKGSPGLYFDMGAYTTLDWEFDNFIIYVPED